MLCWSRWRWSSGMSPTRSWRAATPRASSSSGSSTRGGELWLVETRSRDQMLTSDWPRWSIELINDRSTPVTSFCWSHDGRMALICYQVQLQKSIISTQQHVDYRYISIISTQQHVDCCVDFLQFIAVSLVPLNMNIYIKSPFSEVCINSVYTILLSKISVLAVLRKFCPSLY